MNSLKPIVRVGVLALQGSFALHKPHIEATGARYLEVCKPSDLELIDGIILPGGESATQLKLLKTSDLFNPLREFLLKKPGWGICAGGVLMARTVCNPQQESLDVLDIEIERNAYGRQLQSIFEITDGYEVSYIRAPRIRSCGLEISKNAYREGAATWIECGHLSVTTFHPELNCATPSPWHSRLTDKCRAGMN